CRTTQPISPSSVPRRPGGPRDRGRSRDRAAPFHDEAAVRGEDAHRKARHRPAAEARRHVAGQGAPQCPARLRAARGVHSTRTARRPHGAGLRARSTPRARLLPQARAAAARGLRARLRALHHSPRCWTAAPRLPRRPRAPDRRRSAIPRRQTGGPMNRSPFPFADFVRARDSLVHALVELGEPYGMLTGDTGTGKTALLRELRGQLDRTRHRVLYFSEAKKLGPAGLVKVVGEALRVRTSMCHSVSLDRLLRALSDDVQTIQLWLDEAQDLPTETLAEVRAVVE